MLDEQVARWLVSPAGLDLVTELTQRVDGGEDLLGLTTSVGERQLEVAEVSAAIGAALARRKARERWPAADTMVFTREALEQASDPTLSAHRATRFRDADVFDLCAGVGGDAVALAALARHVTAVESDPGRAVLLEHNAMVHGCTIDVRVADALEVSVTRGASVHADPARRRAGARVRRLGEHVPSVPDLLRRHGAAGAVGIVVSPALDLADPDLPPDVEVEFLQLEGRLVEAALWRGSSRVAGATATATLLPAGLQRSRFGPRPPRLPVGDVGDHLVEVAPAAIRARLHDDVGGEIGARRVSAGRALLSTDGAPPDSAWYRARRVRATLPARAKAIRAWLRSEDPLEVEIVLHGFQGDPQRWWHEIGRPPRGPSGVRVELVRLERGARAIVTEA